MLKCPFCMFENGDDALFCGRCDADVSGVLRAGRNPELESEANPRALIIPAFVPSDPCSTMNGHFSIENCSDVFAKVCPLSWDKLEPTGDSHVRHCDTCKKDVYLCRSQGE